VSPIYVRPEREQAEHDRLIRFLQASYSQKFEALANPGEERLAPVSVASVVHFPDIVLTLDKRLAGVVEIETAASVNNLETMAKWVPFSRIRVPFHLYVPVQGYEAAVRLAEAHAVKAAEIWTYRPATEGFDLVRMHFDPVLAAAKPIKVAVPKMPPPRVEALPVEEPPPTPRPEPAAVSDAAPPNPVRGRTAPAKPQAGKPPVTKPAAKASARKSVKGPAKPPVKAARTKPGVAPKGKASTKPPASKLSAVRRPAVKRPVKSTRTRPARPVVKGGKNGKKGTGARKGR